MISVAPETVFIRVYRFTSRLSHTISVSTAPISRQASVSATPKTNLPVSCEISSKNLEIRRFSWTNLTLASASAESSMAWLKPFSPPFWGGGWGFFCSRGGTYEPFFPS